MTTPASTQQAREQAAWDRIAPGFDRHVTPLTEPLGEQALRLAGVRPGMRFLDVAAGSGALSIPAARLGAHVTATDYSPAMVERLAARAREEGLAADVDSRVMDGSALDLPDDTFDVAGSQNGVSLFPDLDGGLAEMVRVIRPAGRALLVAFGSPVHETEFIAFFFGALRAAVPGFTPPTDPPPPPFRLVDPEKMRRAMTGAQLTDVRVETVDWPVRIRSADHLWEVTASSHPIAAVLLADVSQERRSAARQVLGGMLEERAGADGVAVLHSRMNIGVGTK